MNRRVRLTTGWADYDMGQLVRIGRRAIPKRVEVTFPSTADNWPSAHFVIEVRSGVPVCTEFTIRAHPEGREVRTQDFRAVQIEEWVENILADTAVEVADDGSWTFDSTRTPEESDFREARDEVRFARRNVKRKVTPELLGEVARIYTDHVTGNPTEAVRNAFGTSPRTAARYVERAREAGLLPPTTPGKKMA